jgi:hypothetical protein
MDNIEIDIISFIVLLISIIWMHNYNLYIKNIIYMIIIIFIIDLRILLRIL